MTKKESGMRKEIPDGEKKKMKDRLARHINIEEITADELSTLIKEDDNQDNQVHYNHEIFPDGFFVKFKEGVDFSHPPYSHEQDYILKNPHIVEIVQAVILQTVAGEGLTIAGRITKLFQKKS